MLILSYTYADENNIQLLHFWGNKIIPYRPIKSLKICLIVPNLNVPNHYHSHTEFFFLIANICTNNLHEFTDISILSAGVRRPLVLKIRFR